MSLLKLEIERLKALIQRLTEDKEQLEHTVETQVCRLHGSSTRTRALRFFLSTCWR